MKWKNFKLLLAIALLPMLWASWEIGWSLLKSLAAQSNVNWNIAVAFGMGFVAWLAVFAMLPRPTWAYVLSHELCHAIAVWLSGGKVKDIKVKSNGGFVISNKSSAWISLAPYIIPLYPIIFALIWWPVTIFWKESSEWQWLFFVLWGASWSFYFSFTVSVMKTEQSDFANEGYFFSFTIITLMNTWIALVMLWLWLKPFTPQAGWEQFYTFVKNDYLVIYQFSLKLVNYVKGLI
jgi:hypothetical protein